MFALRSGILIFHEMETGWWLWADPWGSHGPCEESGLVLSQPCSSQRAKWLSLALLRGGLWQAGSLLPRVRAASLHLCVTPALPAEPCFPSPALRKQSLFSFAKSRITVTALFQATHSFNQENTWRHTHRDSRARTLRTHTGTWGRTLTQGQAETYTPRFTHTYPDVQMYTHSHVT